MIQLPQDVSPGVQLGQSLAPFANILGNLYQQRQQLGMQLQAQQAQRNALQQAYQSNIGKGPNQLFSALLAAPGGQELAMQLNELSPGFRQSFAESNWPVDENGNPIQPGQPIGAGAANVPRGTIPAAAPLTPASQATPAEVQSSQETAQDLPPSRRGAIPDPRYAQENIGSEVPPTIYAPTAKERLYNPPLAEAKRQASIDKARQQEESEAIINRKENERKERIERGVALLKQQYPEMAANPDFDGAFQKVATQVNNKYPNLTAAEKEEQAFADMKYLQDRFNRLDTVLNKELRAVGPNFEYKMSLSDDAYNDALKYSREIEGRKFQPELEKVLTSRGLNPVTVSALTDPLPKEDVKAIQALPDSIDEDTFGKRIKKIIPALGGLPGVALSGFLETETGYEAWEKANPGYTSKVTPLIRSYLKKGELPFAIRETLYREKKIPPGVAGRLVRDASEGLNLNSYQENQMDRITFSNKELYDDKRAQADNLFQYLERLLKQGFSE